MSNRPSSDWPAHLDAVVAAPKHHLVLLDNAEVRVLDTSIAPGEVVPLHTHRWPAVYYVLGIGDFVRRDEHGTVLADTRRSSQRAEVGQALWSPPLGPHTLENVGATEIHVVSVELKNRADR
ncbi:MAG: hypothetical protein U0572_01870 [Phycisphaerales bacterium]